MFQSFTRFCWAAAISLAVIGGSTHGIAASSGQEYGAIDDARLGRADAEPGAWLTHGGTQNSERYSKLDQINDGNVANLKPAWFYEFDTVRGQQATPIVVDGVMYTTSAWSKVYALDAATGKEMWTYDPEVPGIFGPKPCCDVVNRGPAVYRGKVYVGTIDGRLIALDARTGKPVWSQVTVDQTKMYAITGAPRVARGKVFIGNAGGEFGGRGYVTAYDADTGKLAWRFYTAPGKPGTRDGTASDEALQRIAAPTWFGDWQDYIGGGHVWNAMTYDAEFNTLYLATGNGFPWNRKFRSAGKGDNLFISSVVAVDADTGKYKWHYQESPGETWDHDSVQDMILTDLEIDGRMRKVLLHAPKNGFFYVIDRETGKVISATNYVPVINWMTGFDAEFRPIIAPNARYENGPFTGSPGEGGGHGWQPFAFSRQTRLVYFPASEGSTYFLPRSSYVFEPGIDAVGIFHGAQHGAVAEDEPPAPVDAAHNAPAPAAAPIPRKAYLLAWDPVAKKPAWTVEGSGGGVLATAGNLVFQGRGRQGVMGEFFAFRADTGEKLWSWKTPNAITPGAISYQIGSTQYVAVSSGAGGVGIVMGGGQTRQQQAGRLLVFKLGGTAKLPDDPPLAPLPEPPALTWSPVAIARGKTVYGHYCARCHGFNANGPNIVPDLRRAAALSDKDAWKAIVIDGALTQNGMIGWSRYLNNQDAEDVRGYVVEAAHKLIRDAAAAAPPAAAR